MNYNGEKGQGQDYFSQQSIPLTLPSPLLTSSACVHVGQYKCVKYALLTEIIFSLSFFTIIIPTLLFLFLKCFFITDFSIDMLILATGYSFGSAY